MGQLCGSGTNIWLHLVSSFPSISVLGKRPRPVLASQEPSPSFFSSSPLKHMIQIIHRTDREVLRILLFALCMCMHTNVCVYIYILCLFHNIIYIYMDKSVFTLYLFQPTVSMPFACHYTRKKLKERIPFNPSLDPAASGFSTGVSSGFSSGSFSSTLQRDSRATLVRS